MSILNDSTLCSNLETYRNEIGGKASGLCTIPKAWRPPFFVIPCSVFGDWKNSSINGKEALLTTIAEVVMSSAEAWLESWPRGIILRSSVSNEGLNDRGQWLSIKLTADYQKSAIKKNIRKIYKKFSAEAACDNIALIVQPLVQSKNEGHISNERRVSKTINHWECEFSNKSYNAFRFNSQRQASPNENDKLKCIHSSDIKPILRKVGRWSSMLMRGPSHIEVAFDADTLWLLQIDFEDEAPDAGVDPKAIIRDPNFSPVDSLDESSLLKKYDPQLNNVGWSKLDNTEDLRELNDNNFPNLYYVTGDILLLEGSASRIKDEIFKVTLGRAVCRTDCKSEKYKKLNLPRSPTVNAEDAYNLMTSTIKTLISEGLNPSEICFIIHRFIPALTAAWVKASPTSQIVEVDTLWGVPDGLQYLPHDSYQYDIKRDEISSETLNYKPEFIQENEDGSWEALKVKRKLARGRSISAPDVRHIARNTYQLAKKRNKPVMIMWFCEVPVEMDVGRNLPWFTMDAHDEVENIEIERPKKDKIVVRNKTDIERAVQKGKFDIVFELIPDVNLYREDEKFLEIVIETAIEHSIPVEMRGSKLAHAYYQLRKAGVSVVGSGINKRERKRGKQVFHKLVRDDIPEKISETGEQTLLAKIAKPESRAALLSKLFEEAVELKNAGSPDDVEAELADLLEVIKSLASATGVDWEAVEATADIKREKRGGFEDGVVLLETSWPTTVKKEPSQPQYISLKDLSRIEVKNGYAKVSFTNLFAEEAEKVIDFGSGLLVKVGLTEGAIVIEVVSRPLDMEQIEFDL